MQTFIKLLYYIFILQVLHFYITKTALWILKRAIFELHNKDSHYQVQTFITQLPLGKKKNC